MINANLLTVFALLTAIGGCAAPSNDDSSNAQNQNLSSIEMRRFETKMISSGSNMPTLDLSEKRRSEVLVLLHENTPETLIRDFRFSDGVVGGDTLDDLISEGYVAADEQSRLHPKIAVLSIPSVSKHMMVRDAIVAATVEKIKAGAADFMEKAASIPTLKSLQPDRYSLFLFSNVLLDDLQINTVEKEYLKADRPLRPGGRYYLSVQEKDASTTREAFGIYGNHIRSYNGVFVGVYGNNRNERTDFNAMGPDRLWPARAPEAPDRDAVAARRAELVNALLKVSRGEDVDESLRNALVRVGFTDPDGRVLTLIFSGADFNALQAIAADFTPDLLGLLNSERNYLEEAYRNSPYASEITFEEYFIWWYHLYYTAVTDALVKDGLIVIPASGVSAYIVVQ